jgi:FKBP-type peptidyl-prolyl cis-trans isomerase
MVTAAPRHVLVLLAACAGLLLAGCGANGEGAPADTGCPVGQAGASCSSSSSTSTSSSSTETNPCTTVPTPTPAAAGQDEFCKQVAVTTTLADGMQYGDITVGTGAVVKTGDTIKVQYTGWLESSGQMFDTSRQPGRQPFQLTLGQHQVIQGWEEGIPGMHYGGKRRLIIPAPLGYGAQGQPPTIPPNAVLVFDVEVLPPG